MENLLIPNREIMIENTTFCGARCIMCPRDKYEGQWAHMGMDLFKSAVDQAAEQDVISINIGGYGDCFMDPQIDKKLKYVHDKYPYIKMTCGNTCQFISGKNLELVSRYIRMLKISMYGYTKQTYENVHGGSLNFENILNNIEQILQLPKEHRPYIIMSYLKLPQNQHELSSWIDYWEPKVDELLVWLPHNWAGAYHNPLITEKEKNTVEYRSCGRPFAGDFSIRVDGRVSVCCFDFNNKLTIGNIKKQSLADILTSEELEKIKKVHTKGQFKGCGLICEYCDQILDRSQAFVYATNDNRAVGVITTHPDLISNTYSFIPSSKE